MEKKNKTAASRKYLLENTPVKRLRFFVEFMRRLGLGMDDVAVAAKTGEAAVRHWFIVDSINIKKLTDVAEYYGYDLVFSYEVPALKIDGVNLTIEEPSPDQSKLDMTRRLSFIRVAMVQNGVTVTELAKRLAVTRDTIQRAFRNDNISIDYVYMIAEEFGWKINIEFRKTVKPTEETSEQ